MNLVQSSFLEADAKAILATPIPQFDVTDRVAWIGTSNGSYTARSGYHFWF